MKKAIVLALDLGTSSVRAMLFDAQGRALPEAEAQSAYSQTISADGGVETDAEALLARTVDTIKQLLHKTDADTKARLAGVGVSCFWHSLVGVGAEGRALTPLFSWADSRAAAQAEALKREMDPEGYHRRTGCELHPNYWPAKLRWLQQTQAAEFGKVTLWMSFAEYLYLRLFGEAKVSLSMASGTGLLNPNTKAWDPDTLKVLPVTESSFNPLAGATETWLGLTGEWAKTLAPLQDLPWVPASGDGACSNVGSGAVGTDRIAINIGTSGAMRVAVRAESVDIPEGLFCYRLDAERFLVGGAFANGGNVFAWAQKTLQIGSVEDDAHAVSKLPPDGHGLTVLPFWAGERSPEWHADARATITGMNLHTTPADLLRASLEAVAYTFGSVHERLLRQYPTATQIIVSGGALTYDPTWTQIMADTFGLPVVTSRVFEASSRGAALLALNALGLISDLDDVPTYLGKTYTPDPENHEIYKKAQARQEALYAKMLG